MTIGGKTQEMALGRYKAEFRRTLRTGDEHDVQFEVGKFIPIGFDVWQGSQGEVGLRRAVSTWYLIVLEPSVPGTAFVAPVVAGGLVLALLLLIVVRVRRAPAPAPEEPVVEVSAAKPLAPALEQPGRITVTGVVTVAAVTVLVGYLVIIGLGGLLSHLGEKEKVQITRGKEKEVQDLRAEQRKKISDYEWVDPKAKTVKLPIERAMELVVEDAAKGNASKLVPAVGPEDKPTLPPVPGKLEPPNPAQPGAAAPAGAAPAQPAGQPAPPAGAPPQPEPASSSKPPAPPPSSSPPPPPPKPPGP